MNKAGFFKSNLKGELAYKSFCPTRLQDLKFEFDKEMLTLIKKAHRIIDKINKINIEDNDYIIDTLMIKEALANNEIEAKKIKIKDYYLNGDIQIDNQLKAIGYSLDLLEELPICNRFLKEVHGILFQGEINKEKYAGEFRKTQNWLGIPGVKLDGAMYIPPNVEDMNAAMIDLENYFHEENDLDPLIKIGLIHYQLMIVQPFVDGNGIIARNFVATYLFDKKILKQNFFLISTSLAKDKVAYYDHLFWVRIKNDYEQWLKYFLTNIINSNTKLLNKLNKL